jgi:hypothetical protein
MSEYFQCGDNAALVGYVYGECETEERRAIDTHLAICAACTAELAALDSTREQLASWVPPEAELGFQIVRPRAAARREAEARSLKPGAWSWTQPLPTWMQAAAACAIFAAGVWMGVGRGTTPAAQESADNVAASAPVTVANAATASDLQALEERLRAEMTRMRTVSAPAPAPRAANANEEELLSRVRSMIEESEQRQQRELAIRVAQVTGEVETQRRLDLTQIQRTLGQLEGQTGAEIRDQRQLVNYLMRVSQQQGR